MDSIDIPSDSVDDYQKSTGAIGGAGMSSPARESTDQAHTGWFGGFRAIRCGLVLLAASSLTLVVASPASAKSTKLKPPGPPKNVVAVPAEGGATVSWTAPTSDGGSPITGYTVAVAGGSCSTDGGTSCLISGLTDGRGYLTRVRAVNAVGTGRASRPGHFVAGQSPDCSNLTPGANLRYCRFANEDLDGYDLAGADFSGARFGHATFDGANLDDTIFDDTTGKAKVTGADFSGAQMVGAAFADVYIESSDFSEANLTDADFNGALLIVDGFYDATMTGGDLNAFWSEDECPDGTLSNDDGNTCVNDLGPPAT